MFLNFGRLASAIFAQDNPLPPVWVHIRLFLMSTCGISSHLNPPKKGFSIRQLRFTAFDAEPHRNLTQEFYHEGDLMNTPSYTLVNLQQGTAEWLIWRSQGIGASDAPTIMGENPWKSPAQLLKEKCEGKSGSPNAAMARGTALEPEARKSYESRSGVCVVPACLQSVKHDWLRASVDGLAVNGSTVVEIKCGESVYRKSSTTWKVPDYYVGQLQHILAITHLPSIDFWCYLPGRPEVHLRVARDDGYIQRLLEVEALFWQEIVKKREAGLQQTAGVGR